MEPMSQEDVESMMQILLNNAKEIRAGHGYSGDEQMHPMAFIFGDSITIMVMDWKDHQSKYSMALRAKHEARRTKAKSLSIVTDTRQVEGDKIIEYFKLDPSITQNISVFRKEYHSILARYGGQVKNLPRELWTEAVTVMTNGPGIPLTIQMAPYIEGENDMIHWLPAKPPRREGSISDLLTDWWS